MTDGMAIGAAAGARELPYVCRWCGHAGSADPLERGRLCERCWTISKLWHSHHDAARQAAVLGRQTGLVAIGVQSVPGPYERYATRIAVVDGVDGRVLADVITGADAWERGDRAALDRIGAVLAGHGAYKVYRNHWCSALYWSFEDRAALLALLNPVLRVEQSPTTSAGVRAAAPWLTSGAELRSLYGRWYGEPLARHQPWPRLDLQYDLLVPGGTGDAIDDARAVLRTCRSIADRSEPVSVDAPWHGLVGPALPGA